MHESLLLLYQEYWKNEEKKVYHTGFVMLSERTSSACKKYAPSMKTATAHSKNNSIRVYLEIRGCTLHYWEAGHCDTDPGTIGRLKNSSEPVEIPIYSCQPGFTEEERDPENQRSNFLCFSFAAPKETYELIINHGSIPSCYLLEFSTYQLCSRFYMAICLAMTESLWIKSLYSRKLIGEDNAQAEEATVALLPMFIREECRGNKLVQGYIKVCKATGKKSKTGNGCMIQVFADEYGKELVGTLLHWSLVYLNVVKSENMFSLNLQDAVWKHSKNKRYASKIILPDISETIQLGSINKNDLVEVMKSMQKFAPEEKPKWELPESLPGNLTKLFLLPAECNIDIMFHSKHQISKTFLTLFKASRPSTAPLTGNVSANDENSDVEMREKPCEDSQPNPYARRLSRLSIYSHTMKKSPQSESDKSSSSGASTSQLNNQNQARPQSRMSIYMKEVQMSLGHSNPNLSMSTNSIQNKQQETQQRTPQFYSYPVPNNNQNSSQLFPQPHISHSALTSPNITQHLSYQQLQPLPHQHQHQQQPAYFSTPPMMHPKMTEYYPYQNVSCASPIPNYLNASQSMIGINGQHVFPQPYYANGGTVNPIFTSSAALLPLNQFNPNNSNNNSNTNTSFGHPQYGSQWQQPNYSQVSSTYARHPYYS